MKSVLTCLRATPLGKALQPVWIDEARLIIQQAAFQEVMKGYAFTGQCLNAGCGEGLYSGFLESFSQVEAIVNLDLVCPAIPQLRQDSRHHAIAGSLIALPLASTSFDACLCSEVIEHIRDDHRAVAELWRILKSGGLLLLSVPTPPAPYDAEHVREGYSLDELSTLVTQHGFTVLRHTYCFYGWKRMLYHLWQWQFHTLGQGRRSVFPRILLQGLSYADRYVKWGKPWDLVMLAKKQ